MKPSFSQYARSRECLFVVRKESCLVADYFKLDQISLQSFAGKPRRANGFFGGVAPSSVRQYLHRRIQVIKKGLDAAIQRHATDRHSNHLRARGPMRRFHLVVGAVFSRANDQARRKCSVTDCQTIRFG